MSEDAARDQRSSRVSRPAGRAEELLSSSPLTVSGLKMKIKTTRFWSAVLSASLTFEREPS